MKYLKYSLIALVVAALCNLFVSNGASIMPLSFSREVKTGVVAKSTDRTKRSSDQQIVRIVDANCEGCTFKVGPGSVNSSEPIAYSGAMSVSNTYNLDVGASSGDYVLYVTRHNLSFIMRTVAVTWDPNRCLENMHYCE